MDVLKAFCKNNVIYIDKTVNVSENINGKIDKLVVEGTCKFNDVDCGFTLIDNITNYFILLEHEDVKGVSITKEIKPTSFGETIYIKGETITIELNDSKKLNLKNIYNKFL